MPSPIFVLVASLLVQGSRPSVPPDQIAWQRSLADALSIAGTEHRPLLVAINVDGESGSDRIVREEYRDPEFVAATRRFACVIGHPLRHTPRDHDDDGRRIVCPRLGSVTCGEHLALEPAIFDAYLGGERVSPRHAVVLADGTKAFDLYYQFDITVLDRAVAKSAADAPPDRTEEPWFDVHHEKDVLFDELAGARPSWRRTTFEHFVEDAPDADVAASSVRAIGRRGDAGSVEVLRFLLQSGAAPVDDVVDAAIERGIARELGLAARETILGAGRYPGAASLGLDRRLLRVLARTAEAEPALRAVILAHRALGAASDRTAAHAALADAYSPEEVARIDAAIEAEGGALDVEALLRLAARIGASGATVVAAPVPAKPIDELVGDLESAERALAGHESEPAAAKRFGLANLALARARLEMSGPDVALLLQDADTWLARAAAASPEDDEIAIERARAKYFLSRFDEQAAIAGEVLARARARAAKTPRDRSRTTLSAPDAYAALGRQGAPSDGPDSAQAEIEGAAALADDAVALEALRWLGDAEGRRIGADAADPARAAASLVRGARALASACAHTATKEVDYQSLASYLRAVGMTRASLAASRAGLERFPESPVLRDLARETFAQCGRIDAFVVQADWLAALHPDSATCAWYAGHAHVLAAEWGRRGEDVDTALAEYAAASARFARSLELEPGFADTAGHYLAACELGRGFTLRIAGREQDAADALARALAMRPAIGDARDGLDREAVDLVDAVLEWTAPRPSRVDPIALADALSRAVPGTSRWLVAVADSALREGLRADGRGATTVPVPAALRVEGAAEVVSEPSAIGDRWLALSIEVARRAHAIADDEGARHALAQSATVQAERLLVRGRDAEALPLLEESARILGESGSSGDPFELARRLRARLGEPRPIARPGR